LWLTASLGVALIVPLTGSFELIFPEAGDFAGFAAIFLLFIFSPLALFVAPS
jgi:hypothetical protein